MSVDHFYKFHREARLSKARVCRSRSFLCTSSRINISRITRRKRFLFWLLMMGIHPFPSRLPSKSVIKSTSSASFRRKVSALHGKNWKIHCHIKIIRRRRRRRRAVKGETKKWKNWRQSIKQKTGDYGRQKIFKIIAVPSRNKITYLTSRRHTSGTVKISM